MYRNIYGLYHRSTATSRRGYWFAINPLDNTESLLVIDPLFLMSMAQPPDHRQRNKLAGIDLALRHKEFVVSRSIGVNASGINLFFWWFDIIEVDFLE